MAARQVYNILNNMPTHCFSRSSLCTAHEITATQNDRYCPFLYRCRLVIVSLPNVVFQRFPDVRFHETVAEKDIIFMTIWTQLSFSVVLKLTKTLHNISCLVTITSTFHYHWQSASVSDKLSIFIPGLDFPRQFWSTLNRFQTGKQEGQLLQTESAHLTWLYCMVAVQKAFQSETV